MKKPNSPFSLCCVVVLIAFAVFMVWYIPSLSSVRGKTEETRQLLETSIGREGKQQDEYDKAVADLPVVQEELKEKQPLAEQAAQKVTDLKARRKELRAEKQSLEAANNPVEENTNPEATDSDKETKSNPESSSKQETEGTNGSETAESEKESAEETGSNSDEEITESKEGGSNGK